MDKLDFTGKNVLVVGGTSGIGNGIAQKFRSHGAAVHVWGTRESLSDYDDERCDYEGLHYQQVNVAQNDEIESVTIPFNRLDTLVLSHGSMDDKPYDIDCFKRILDTNLTSCLACCNRFEKMLKASKGSVVLLNSTSSLQAVTMSPAYCTSKYALTGLTKVLARAWAPTQVRVNGIGPGVILTRMADSFASNQQFMDSVISKQPFGRLGTVDEIADTALFLASPMASYITGQTIYVDGGHTLEDIL
jgi:3-oxoacyl-[acyl-carrier protein] reductase